MSRSGDMVALVAALATVGVAAAVFSMEPEETTPPVTTSTGPPATWATTVPPTTTTTALVPGSPNDPWGPILCPGVPHPAHHRPCQSRSATRIAPDSRSESRSATRNAGSDSPTSDDSHLASIRQCESGGDYQATSGQYRGAYQFDQETWESVGGSGDPAAASPAEQDQRAAALKAQRGSNPWPNCG